MTRIRYLLLKTHNVTGLKYFCQTSNEGKKRDRYKGSGVRWTYHLRKHGGGNKYVTTHIVAMFDRDNPNFEAEIPEFALNWSRVNNIVEDPGYANLQEENGLDGCPPGKKQSPEHIAKKSEARKGHVVSDETRAKTSTSMKGIPKSAEHSANISAGKKGKKQSDEHRASKKGQIPWNKGKKLSAEHKAKLSAGKKGKKYSKRGAVA